MLKTLTTCLAFFCITNFVFAQWEQTKGPEGGNITQILRHKDKLWASTTGGLWFSSDEAGSWQRHAGIPFKYTGLALHVHQGALYSLVRAYEPGWWDYKYLVYRSTDDGLSWNAISEVPFFYPFGVRFATVKGRLFILEDSEYFQSPDNGVTWVPVNLPADYAYLTFDTATLIARDYFEGVFISTDAADSWQQIADSSENFLNFYFIRGNMIVAEKLFGNDIKTVISHDLGQSWSDFPEPPNPLNYGLQFQHGGGDTIIGLTDKIYFSTDLGGNWQLWGNSTPQFVYPAILTPYGALGYNNKGVWKYSYSLGQWQKANNGLRIAYVYDIFRNDNLLFAHTGTGLFVSPDEGDHWQEAALPASTVYGNMTLSGDTLYACIYGALLYAPANGSAGWDTLAAGPGFNSLADHISVQGDNIVCTAHNDIIIVNRHTGSFESLLLPASSSSHFNHFLRIIGDRYVYTDNNGGAYYSDNHGVTWEQTLNQYLPGNNTGNRLEYHLSRLFLFTRNGVYISEDNGTNWTGPVTNGLPVNSSDDIPAVTSMASSGNLLLIAVSGYGVCISTNLGADWQLFNEGFGDVRPSQLCAFGSRFYAGTTNAGVWRRVSDLDLLSGVVYHDDNNNGVRDNGEKSFPGRMLQTRPSDFFSVSQSDGTYSMYADLSNDTLKVLPFSPYVTFNPPFYTASQGAGGLDFGVYVTPGIQDLDVVLTNVQPFNRGFPVDLVITCRNKGTSVQNPVVILKVDPVLEYTGASPLPDSLTGPLEFAWHLPALEAFQSTDIVVHFFTSLSAEAGDPVNAQATIYPLAQDVSAADNYSALRDSVVASYDPNDKQVTPGPNFSPAQIADGERLIYTIRFQNTGTYPATFVRIVDTLDQDFDIASLEVLSASHPFTWNLRGQNILEFFFDNINLPDSSSNEAASHGFVKYAVRPKSNLPLGTALPNRAFIFFDFNEPVETNTTGTLIAWPLRTFQPQLFAPLAISPNPAAQWVEIEREDAAPVWLVVNNASGKTIVNQRVENKKIRIDLHDWPQGIYRVAMGDRQGLRSGWIVVQR